MISFYSKGFLRSLRAWRNPSRQRSAQVAANLAELIQPCPCATLRPDLLSGGTERRVAGWSPRGFPGSRGAGGVARGRREAPRGGGRHREAPTRVWSVRNVSDRGSVTKHVKTYKQHSILVLQLVLLKYTYELLSSCSRARHAAPWSARLPSGPDLPLGS